MQTVTKQQNKHSPKRDQTPHHVALFEMRSVKSLVLSVATNMNAVVNRVTSSQDALTHLGSEAGTQTPQSLGVLRSPDGNPGRRNREEPPPVGSSSLDSMFGWHISNLELWTTRQRENHVRS